MIYLKNSTEKQECFIPKNGNYIGRKTYKEGMEAQKALISAITIDDNGVYENENGYSPVEVALPIGKTTITENGVYDFSNGGFQKDTSIDIGGVYLCRGNGFMFPVNGVGNWSLEVIFKNLNSDGEYFENTMRGIIGDKNIYIAEDATDPNYIYAKYGDWESGRYAIDEEFHYLKLNEEGFWIDNVLMETNTNNTPVEIEEWVIINGIYGFNIQETYNYPNSGYYQAVRIGFNGETKMFVYPDGVGYADVNGEDRYGYVWRVVSSNPQYVPYLSVGYGWREVRGMKEVSVNVGDCPEMPVIGTLEMDVTENQTYYRGASDGYDAYNKVIVKVNVPRIELYPLDVTENGTYEGAYNVVNVNVPQGESCNLEDKWVTPSMDDRDGNGLIVVNPSEGYDGLYRAVINPTTIYNEGVEEGKTQGGDCPELTTLDVTENGTYEGAFNVVNVDVPQEGGSCDLEHLTITDNGYYEPKAEESGYLIVNENSAFDTGVKLVENSTIEILFNTGNYDGNIPTLIGCEDAGWDNSTFAVRWYSGNLSIKVGSQEISIPMGAEEEATKFHKLKFGYSEGVYLDDNYIEPFATEWTMNQNTIYIGAMHNPTNGDTNGVWRPWNGYIGNVKIYGEKNGEVRDFTFTCGDFGRWGEYETDGNILPNIMGEGGATFSCCKQYGDKPFDGYSSVSVNIDIEPFKEEGRNEVRNNLQSIEITENGRYSVEDQIYIEYLDYNGGYHTDTITTYDINRIEVTFKADTSESINGQGQPFILGGSLWGLEENGENNACARAIQYAYGRIIGYWEGKCTNAVGVKDGEWITIILDENGMNVKYPTYETHSDYTYDNGKTNSGVDIFPFIIGGQGKRIDLEDGSYTSSLIEDSQFRGLITEVKITTNSMGEITYIPKNSGYGVWDRKVENTGEYLSALEPTEGEVTFNGEYVKKYGEGWKEINVNVPTIQEQIRDYYYCPLIVADAGFGELAKSWDENDVVLNNYDGAVIEDVLYVPTFSNRNEFRTKEKARFVQRIDIPSDSMGGLEFGDGVEYYVNNSEAHNYTSLTKIVLGSDMETLNFGSTDSFPTLNEIWDYSISSEFDVYFSIPNVKSGGTLYLKTQSHESVWRNKLPEDWTIEYI